jgi:ketosteroid isomerase-like protein
VAEEENLRVVQSAYAAFLAGDLAALLSALSDDIEWRIPGPPDVLPFAGIHRGRRQVGEFFATLGATLEFEVFEPRELIARGNKVIVLGHRRDRFRKTGRTADTEWAEVFTLRDGRITSYIVYSDTAALVDAARGGGGKDSAPPAPDSRRATDGRET